MEDWIGNIVSFGIAKYQIQRKAIKVLKMEKQERFVCRPSDKSFIYLVNDSDPHITGRAHPHNSWNDKHKRPRDPTLGGQTDLISTF